MKNLLALFLFLSALSCAFTTNDDQHPAEQSGEIKILNDREKWIALFLQNKEHIADGFDFPVGPPDAKGYYNAQPMGVNLHLGDDWNGVGGGNTDLGDPVYSVAHGFVDNVSNEGGGWGNVVRIVHAYYKSDSLQLVESLYAHLETVLVKQGAWIKRGEKLGTIGNCGGTYLAHLHLEMRDSVRMVLGGGYSDATTGYLKPTDFIKAHCPKK
ncbi:MAG: M23 family metallopeptidase [Flavobacteriales bacterium]|nr:M23 family metallopeptidase [Flavobacteriales bacterium]